MWFAAPRMSGADYAKLVFGLLLAGSVPYISICFDFQLLLYANMKIDWFDDDI